MSPAVAMLSPSPGHEKLPAPGLARTLAGSSSRNRAAVRSSPLFCSRSKSVGGSSLATQEDIAEVDGRKGEPISPKVTCIGQVRTRKKKSWSPPPPPKASPRSKEARKPWECFHKVLLCSLFAGRKKPKGWLPWWKWSRSGLYQRREPDSSGAPPLQFIAIRGDEEELEPTTQPPNNALLLMRCRSTPHNRASSLAASVRCALSPLPEQYLQKTPTAAAKEERDKGTRVEIRSRTKKKGNEKWCQLAAAAEMSEKEEEEEETGSESRPLVLTRSRSEPARRQRGVGIERARWKASTVT